MGGEILGKSVLSALLESDSQDTHITERMGLNGRRTSLEYVIKRLERAYPSQYPEDSE